MTYEKHFHCGCASKYRQSFCTETPVRLPRSLLKLRGDVVCPTLHSTIPSAPASGLLWGPQIFGYGMALSFFRAHPQITKGLERKKERKNQNPEQESVEGGGWILADAVLVLSKDVRTEHPEPGSHLGIGLWVHEQGIIVT